MMFPRIVSFGALVSVCLSLAPVQSSNVFVVAPSGGQFTQIQAAIDAAANGDSILVKSGTYAGFSIVNRARLDVVADAGSTVTILGRVLVQNCQGYIVLSGLTVNAQDVATDADRHALTLTNDTGPVRVMSCSLTGPTNGGGPYIAYCRDGFGALVSGSSDVEFVACTFQGSRISYYNGSHGLSCSGSSVAVYDSVLNGGDSTCYDCAWVGAPGGAGAYIADGFLFASRCNFNGGDGANGPDLTDGGQGGAGLRVHGPTATANLLDCITLGGAGGLGDFGGFGWCCGLSCIGVDGNPGPPTATTGGATIQLLPGPGCTMTVPRIVRETFGVTLSVSGQPGDMVYFSLSNSTDFTWQPAFSGVSFWSTIFPPEWRRFGVIGPSGVFSRTLFFPDMGPGILAQNWHFQTLHRDTQGVSILGPGRTMVLLDSSL